MFIGWFQNGCLELRAMVTDRFLPDQIAPAVAVLARDDTTRRAPVIL